MENMLEMYCRRFGDRVAVSGEHAVGPCPFCGESGFSVLQDRSSGTGKICAAHGVPGVFLCKSCGRSGDSLRYMTRVEEIAYSEACTILGIRKGA